MHFDDNKKTLEISIREIAFSARSSNSEGYISRRLRARIGHHAHARYQDNSSGETEYYIKFRTTVDEWSVFIRGRVDVVHKNGNKVHLEEIKSTTLDIDDFEEDEAYMLQLQLYCHYFYEYEGFGDITADLIIFDPVNDRKRVISVRPEPMKQLLHDHLREIIQQRDQVKAHREQLKLRSETIQFPYSTYRPYQQEIIEKIQTLLTNQHKIMLHAPPGIGKTISTLYPALKHVIAEGTRLFVVTSKTTQQLIYTTAIRDLQRSGAEFKAIKITAKGKVCHTDQYDCYDMDCPYLANYFEVDAQMIVSDLLELDLIEQDPIKEEARYHKICPFELSLDVALGCDLILSDFNYIFHPRVKFQRFQTDFEESTLIIDEAHNLVDRAADYYSDHLGIREIQQVQSFLKQSNAGSDVLDQVNLHLKRLIRYIQRLKDQIANIEVESSTVVFDHKFFDSFQLKLDDLLIQYINSLPFEPKKKDPLIKFSDHLKFFTLLLRETENPEFEEIYDLDNRRARILCKSAANKLEEQMEGFRNVICQSATLEPLEYYQTMLGLSETTSVLKYPNPFPEENRVYLIEPNISTTYRERNLFIGQLAELIVSTCSVRGGNYLVFFSSFKYLKKVRHSLRTGLSKRVLVQQPDMTDKQRERFLNQLKRKNNVIIMAVMGGIFAEGIDYTGEMASGAIIVGPGLPQINFDQELKKEYFDQTYGRGFDFAYKFPGMSKVIQAAGRVFRTEQDKGFVLFVGHRFTTDQYFHLLPKDTEIKTGQVIEELKLFWESMQ